MLEGGKFEKFVIKIAEDCNQFNMVCAGLIEGDIFFLSFLDMIQVP